LDKENKKIPIYIFGKKYCVHESLTIQKAMEYSGFRFIRNCGCRGGVCGACITMYCFPNDYRIRTALACQKIVEPEMYLTQVPFVPGRKATYDILDNPQIAENPIQKLYPEASRCVFCNTCSKACPMDIEVMDYIAAAIQGDIREVAQISFECVMCGLCAARCPAEISQFNVALLARRVYGSHILPFPPDLKLRVKEIREGKYQEVLDRLSQIDTEKLREIYSKREQEPQESEGWEPKKKDFPLPYLR